MATLRFDLYQDTAYPYAPSPANYLNAFTRQITAADGAAWTGLFDSSAGDKTFNTLNFGGTVRSGSNALAVDWNQAGDGVTISTGLKWNDVKNINLDSFDGASLSLRNFVDVLVALTANTTGQSVSVDGSKRGKIDLGSGADTLFVGVDSNNGSNGANDFYINTGAGADTVRITRSTIDYSITAFRENYAERWTNTFIRLGDGNDSIVADGSNDTVWGGADNDTAELRGGTNRFDGEAGFDTAIFRGLKNDYLIETVTGGYKVTDLKTGVDGDDGVTSVLNVEQLVFKDQVVAIGGNQAPGAVNDSASTAEDTAVAIAVLANDTDADGNPLSITGFTQGANGTVALVGGQLVYTPDADFNGPDQFSYTISDGQSGSDTATVDVTVTPVNDAPVATSDVYFGTEDVAFAGDLSLNDVDVDGDTLTYSQLGGPYPGLVLNADGTFTYTPPADVNGLVGFEYQVGDGNGGVANAGVVISLAAVNDAPVAVGETYLGTEDTPIAGDLALNDSDVDGDALSYSLVGAALSGLVLNPDGTFTYTPPANLNGVVGFGYQVSDGQGGTATAAVTINLEAVNDAPVAVGEVFLGTEDTPITGNLALNDSDVDGDALTYSQLGGPYPGLVLNADGTFTYTPPADFNGLTGFEYQVSDGNGGVANAGVLIDVAAVNDAPVGVNDTASTAFQTAVVIDVLANDSDVEGEVLTAGGVTAPANGTLSNVGGTITYTPNAGFSGTDSFTYRPFDGTEQGNATTVTVTVGAPGNTAPVAVADSFEVQEGRVLSVAGPGLLANDFDSDGDDLIATQFTQGSNGAVTMVTDGSFTYTPNADFAGTDSFTYRISDGTAFSDFATVTITVLEGTPIAAPDSFSVHWADMLSIAAPGLLANDSDPNGDALIASQFTQGANGAVTMVTDGSFTYTPNAGFVGQDSFTYRISDGVLFSAFATVTVNVTNDAPVAAADVFSVQEGGVLSVAGPGLLANDFDIDGDDLIATQFTQGSNGAVTMVTDGSFTYAPNAGFSGTDSFTYRIFDGAAFSDFATVTITVLEGTPIAVADAFSVVAGQVLSIAAPGLLANDSDPNGDALIASQFTQGSNGAVTLVTDGSFTYTPNAGFLGTDSFTYRISDGPNFSAFATVTITVTAPGNTAPVAVDDDLVGTEDTSLAGSVASNDSDADLDALTYALVGLGPDGLTFNADGSFTYDPPANLNGQVSFTYEASDGQGGSDQAVATITLAPVEDSPFSVDDTASTDFGAPVTIDVLANDTEVDGQALEVILWSSPSTGTVAVNPDNTITFTPGAAGNVTFSYRAFDGVGFGNVAFVTVTVGPQPNQPPVASDVFFTIDEDTLFSANLFGFTSDPDLNQASIQVLGTTNLSVTSFSGASGAIEVQPVPDFNGIATITYQVTDAGGLTDTGVVTLTVTPVNDAPVGVADITSTAFETAVVIDVLANDTDVDSTVLVAGGTTAPANGTLSNVGGTITYTPNTGFSGTDTFTYRPFDGALQGNATTVTVTVAGPANQPPVANDDTATINEGDAFGMFLAVDVLANDTDPNNDPLTVTGASLVGTAPVLVQNTPGSVRYTITDADFFGSFVIDYTIGDGQGGPDTGQLTVTVNPVDDAPAPQADGTPATPFIVGLEDQVIVLPIADIMANDTHPDGTAALAGTVFDGIVAAGPGIDSFVAVGNEVLLLPVAGFSGGTSFTYQVRDADGDVAQALVFVAYTPVNDAPVAQDDAFARTAAPTQTLSAAQLLANDFDPDNLNSNPADDQVLSIIQVQAISGGTVVLNADQSIATTFTGGPVQFRYTLSDGTTTDDAVVTLNAPPVAADDAITILENVSWSNYHFVAVLANDSDPESDPLSIAAIDTTGTPIIADVVGGQLRFYVNDSTNDTNGVFVIGYTVSDGLGSDQGQVTITVTPENDAPRDPEFTDNALGLTTAEDVPLIIDVATLLADDINPADEEQVVLLHDVSNWFGGSIADNGDGTLTFTPTANYNGTAGFYYRAEDAQGAVGNLVFVQLTVTAVDDPVAANDDIIAREFQAGGTQTITRAQLLGNDSAPDGDEVITAASIVSGIGSLTLNADQSITVTYAAGQLPVFTYTLSDGTSTDTATVTLNSGPQVTGTAGTLTWTEDLTDYIYDSGLIALAGITDPNGDALQIVDFQSGSNFGVSDPAWDTFAAFYDYAYFRPFPEDFNGPTTLTFTVSDGNAATDLTVTINVVVQAVNDAAKDSDQYSPGYGGDQSGTDGGFVTAEGTAITILKSALLADDYDPEGDAFSIVGFGINSGIGTVVDNGDSYTFTPYSFHENFVGETAGFYYLLEDANGAQSYNYVFIEFTNTPDLITANDDVVARATGTSQTIAAGTILANDTDPDPGDTKTIIDVVAVNGLDAVSLDATGDVLVEYAAVSTGRASFTYTVQDSTGNTDTATVELNRTPAATGEGPITMSEGPDYVFIPYSTLLANDTDADGDPLTVYIYNYGYTGSNVFVQYDTQGGEAGVRVTLYQDEYTGPAEFQYYVYDGNAFSDFVTVTLDVVAGDDVPKANTDYWYYNGAQYNDENPATNAMVGLEDEVLEFPVSLLTQGQFINGAYQYGADENDDGTLAQLTIASIASPYGAVEIVDIGGVDHVRFTPNADVNSAYAWNQASFDWSRIYLTYSVDDGSTVSNTTQAYLLILPVNDVPVTNDDSFTVIGDGPYTLNIGQAGGQFDVRANDASPDDYPYSIYDYSTLASVAAISGGLVSFDGDTLTFTPDGSGDPMVFEYTLLDADGDSDTAQVTLDVLPAAPQAFYFSGSVPAYGRELWVYDPASFDPNLGSAFATMVDAAEAAGGPGSGNPFEITALSGTVFWRDEYNNNWNAYNPGFGWQTLAGVDTEGFDNALDPADRNLGVRSGDYFWGATQGEGDTLTAWDESGNYETQTYLLGFDRSLLTDAGHDPAYVAMVGTYDPVTDSFNDAEQVHAVLWSPGFNGFGTYQITDGGDTSNDVTEIAGLQVVQNPGDGDAYAKTIYFAGDFTDDLGIFHANALWRVTTTYDGFDWNSNQVPQFLDNGSGGTVQANARALMVTDVPYAGNTVERLFWFQDDNAGNGQIATQYDDFFGGFGTSTGSGYFGNPFDGIEIKPWQDGVVLTGYVPGTDTLFLANWTDADGDGFFTLDAMLETFGGTLEQLVVDDAGYVAFVQDDGTNDTLYLATVGGLQYNVQYAGEITDLRLAGGRLVYVAEGAGGFPTLFDLDLATLGTLEVPTDEPTGGNAGNGFTSSYANVALAGGLVFEADFGGNNFRLFSTDGVNVNFPSGGGVLRTSEGANLNGDWVGTAYVTDFALSGLYSISATGVVTDLYLASTNFSDEAEVLGQKVLFGTTSAAVNEVLVYDDATGNTDTLLANHLLGAASTVGSTIIFNALDFLNAPNTDADPTNNVWTLYSYDGTAVTKLMDLPTGAGGGQNVYEWSRHQDFLGTDDRIFWKQANDTAGIEVRTIDLTAADPGATLAIVDINPGTADGANWGDAVFAGGRLYWQASVDGTADSMRLYSTTDGTDVVQVTGIDLNPGYQFPYYPVSIGDDVFFLASSTASGTWGVFQIEAGNTDAVQITPDDFNYTTALAAIGGDLYFASDENGTVEIYSMPGGQGVTPTQLTNLGGSDFNALGDIFAADGQVYFRYDDGVTGSELWVLDSTGAAGARLVADINQTVQQNGYAPGQVVAVPNPLEQMLAGTFQPVTVFPT